MTDMRGTGVPVATNPTPNVGNGDFKRSSRSGVPPVFAENSLVLGRAAEDKAGDSHESANE